MLGPESLLDHMAGQPVWPPPLGWRAQVTHSRGSCLYAVSLSFQPLLWVAARAFCHAHRNDQLAYQLCIKQWRQTASSPGQPAVSRRNDWKWLCSLALFQKPIPLSAALSHPHRMRVRSLSDPETVPFVVEELFPVDVCH